VGKPRIPPGSFLTGHEGNAIMGPARVRIVRRAKVGRSVLMFGMRGWAMILAAVLAVGLRGAQVQPLQAGQPAQGGPSVQGPSAGNVPTCRDNGAFVRCLVLQTGPNQDQDELWECASGHIKFNMDDSGRQQVAFDGTCAIEVHHAGDPAWVWAGGYSDHDQVCPAGELSRTASGEEWEIGPDCVEAPGASLDDLGPPASWDSAPIVWSSDALPAPAACGWTQSC
jgi:hypothetical protein